MTKAELFAQMQQIAAPIIEAYRDDLAKHDRALVEGAAAGDVFLWTPRPYGTFLIVLARGGRPNTSAALHFGAIQSTSGGQAADQWHALTFQPNGGAEISRCSDPGAAVEAYDAEARTAQETVSELRL
jgi:hypothetical protein